MQTQKNIAAFLALWAIAILGTSVAYGSQIAVPSAPAANYFLVSTSTGQYIATSTLDARFFSNTSSANWAGTWQTFSPSHFLTSLAGAASSTLLGDNNTFTGKDVFGNTGGVYVTSAGSGVGGVGFNSIPDGSYTAGVAGYGALFQLAPSTGVFTMYAEGTAAAGSAHSHTQTMNWDGSGNVFFPQGFDSQASSTISVLHLGTVLEVASGGTASTTLGGILSGNGVSAVRSATVSSPLLFSNNTLSIQTASGSQAGAISAADWNRFNNQVSTTSTNTWAAKQTFGAASTTDLTASHSFYTPFTSGLGAFDVNNKLYNISTTSMVASITGSAGSVANAHTVSGSITGTSFNGSAAVSDWTLNMSNANSWTARQTFAAASTTDLTASNSFFVNFAGGLLYSGAGKQVLTIATSSLFGSGTAGNVVMLNGAGNLVLAATSTSGSGTVTSITGGTGLNGGAITTSGTLALKSYLATSTADTANQISVFTSTNATPATFGGFTNFTFNSATNNFTVINASTTNVSASQSLFVASKQVNPYQNATLAYGATSTAWAGTTTETTLVAPFAGTLQDVQCSTATTTPDTSTDTLNAQFFINGTAVVPALVASTTRGTVTFTSNNTFVRGDMIQARFGSPVSSPLEISCTPRVTVTTF